MKIGVSMIVKDEQEMLPVCIDTIKEFDEIMILDTGSEDTKYLTELNERYINVITIIGEYKWNDNFAEARNEARECVRETMDWILTIDADEELKSSYEDVVKWCEKAEKEGKKTVSVKMIDKNGEDFYFPRLSKNTKEIKYQSIVHNVLNHDDHYHSDIEILYKRSPAHDKDPNREMRMLGKAVIEEPNNYRMKYYLGKAYFTRKDYWGAMGMLGILIDEAPNDYHYTDAQIIMGKCWHHFGKYNKARDCWGKALVRNLECKEAYELIGKISGPINKKASKRHAEIATNEGVIFIRNNEKEKEIPQKEEMDEKGKEYYDEMYKRGYDTTRYQLLYKDIAEKCGSEPTLDIGCGTGDLFRFIDRLAGFDISSEGINQAKEKLGEVLSYEAEHTKKRMIDERIWQGDIYEEEIESGYENYLLIEVLEHLKDDKKIIGKIPKGKKIIFTVPSFKDPSHVRTFNREKVKERYGDQIIIEAISRYEMGINGNVWGKVETESDRPYILMVQAVKK